MLNWLRQRKNPAPDLAAALHRGFAALKQEQGPLRGERSRLGRSSEVQMPWTLHFPSTLYTHPSTLYTHPCTLTLIPVPCPLTLFRGEAA